MRSQPGTQQRPEAFQGVDMYFMKTISIFVPSILACRMIDLLMQIAPFTQAVVNVIFIRVELATERDCAGNHRLDRHLLYIGEHSDDHFTISLEQSQHGRLVSSQGSTSTLAFQTSSSPWATRFCHFCRQPFVSSHQVDFIRFYFTAQLDWLFFSTIPWRSWLVIAWASPDDKSNADAICSFERFRPMNYKHITQTRNGWW